MWLSTISIILYYSNKKNLGRNSQMKHPWKTSQIRAKNFKRWIAPVKIREEILRWNTLEKPPKFGRRTLSGRSHPFRRYRLFFVRSTYFISQLTHRTDRWSQIQYTRFATFEFQNNLSCVNLTKSVVICWVNWWQIWYPFTPSPQKWINKPR